MTDLLASGLLAKSGSSGGGSPIGIFVIIGIALIGYFVILRPRSRQRAAAASARGRAEVGDRVTTTAGLIATVVAIEDDDVTLEVAPGVYSHYLPGAILRVLDPPEPLEHDGHDDLDGNGTDETHADSESHADTEQPPVVDEPTDS